MLTTTEDGVVMMTHSFVSERARYYLYSVDGGLVGSWSIRDAMRVITQHEGTYYGRSPGDTLAVKAAWIDGPYELLPRGLNGYSMVADGAELFVGSGGGDVLHFDGSRRRVLCQLPDGQWEHVFGLDDRTVHAQAWGIGIVGVLGNRREPVTSLLAFERVSGAIRQRTRLANSRFPALHPNGYLYVADATSVSCLPAAGGRLRRVFEACGTITVMGVVGSDLVIGIKEDERHDLVQIAGPVCTASAPREEG